MYMYVHAYIICTVCILHVLVSLSLSVASILLKAATLSLSCSLVGSGFTIDERSKALIFFSFCGTARD